MNKYQKTGAKLISMAFVGSLFVPMLASAEESTSTIKDLRGVPPKERLEELRAKAEQQKLEMKNKIEEMKQNRASTTEARKEKMDDKRDERRGKIAERVAEFVGKVKERLTATTERFDKIILRIDSRITKLDTAGATTTEAKAFLADAKAKLVIAKTDIANISASTTTSTSTADLKLVYEGLKSQFDKAKSDLKAVQEALVKTITSLGPINAELKSGKNASSTDSKKND